MFFTQIVHKDLGCASYMVASAETNECIVVDPRWEIEPYLEAAEQHNLTITSIIETHNHADHVSGHGRLAQLTGARIYVHKDADVDFVHETVADGDVIDLHDVKVYIIHTPGHRPEHIALAVQDETRGAEPWIVLTGDSLFVGDVARPDLAVEGREGARLLFHSLQDKLLELPEFASVYPAHVAGSLCGRVSSEVPSTTIGFEKRYNAALGIRDEGEFVSYMNKDLPHRPPNMSRIVEINRGPLSTVSPSPRRLSAQDVAERAQSIVILDVRDTDAYLGSHLIGSIHVPVRGAQFGTRVGFLVPVDSQLAIVVDSEDQACAAFDGLQVVAYQNLAGYLLFHDWEASGGKVSSISVGDPRDVEPDISKGRTTIVDVREPSEWASGIVAGAVLIPYRELVERAGEVSKEKPVAVICQSGARSVIAASILERAGLSEVMSVTGGMSAWREAGLSTTNPPNGGL